MEQSDYKWFLLTQGKPRQLDRAGQILEINGGKVEIAGEPASVGSTFEADEELTAIPANDYVAILVKWL